MLGTVSSWRGWKWEARVEAATPSGKVLNKLTSLMSKDIDLKDTGIVVFGSAPLEFASLLHVKSADIDITPDQFLEHLRNRVREWKLDVGDPFVQVLPPTVFKAGKNYLLRACGLKLNEIEIIIPHPIDIVFGKLHRMEEKDYTAINELVETFGRPTFDDLHHYMIENADIFEASSETIDKLVTNIEVLWVYLGGQPLEIRTKYLESSLRETAKLFNEGNEALSEAQAFARTHLK
jgi:hypothetical protein